ncbi:MAG: alanine--tRNA ligase [Candidatus Poribacteria bacterium]|nr:MAG: alanine--tRNA ligase [Candidatus Poribacteria bacterium]
MRTSRAIRSEFLRFFEERGHTIVPSAPLIPQNDPTLLFTNAGMNQFKDVFLGIGTRPYKRAADTQKCVRVSGKHNDLEEVGYSHHHHTFFEMLGNWSFGDYFKKEAIAWAWELLTEVWGLPKDRLYATVFAGDEEDGVPPDEEAAELWTSVTDMDPSHILRFGKKDNFWEMGETGPCGPCSEIHIDLTPDGSGGKLVNAGSPEVVEVWNLVFIQFNRRSDGKLEPLPAHHVDTGMGFERITAVLQGKRSNYDTDIFTPLIQRIEELSGTDYETGDERSVRVPTRVIADHIRMLAFTIADGGLPGNEGRGYVIRRILRRAVRYGRVLGFTDPFLFQLVPVLVETMGDVFPEIAERQEHVQRVIRAEEESFGRTLDRGLELFEEIAGRLEASGERTVPGEEAFRLYDTYGFPLDLTQLLARERGMTVDQERFEELMEQQRERARAAQRFQLDLSEVARWQTVSEGPDSEFTGYESLEEPEAQIRRARVLRDAQGNPVYQLVLDRTPFYAESGGQIGDQGTLEIGEEVVRVLDTQKDEDGTIVHIVDRLPEDLTAPVRARVDADRRRATMRAHSATHLLHAALRKFLGDHVTQAGSLVAPDRLRFDFTHYEAVPQSALEEIEAFVNEQVLANLPVVVEWMPLDEAKRRGAMALFGEKYGEIVRTVQMGEVSLELCGGTHVSGTAEVGPFRLLREGSSASGVRRVEAVTGWGAYETIREAERTLREAASVVGARQREELIERLERLLAELKSLERETAELRRRAAMASLDRYLSEATALNGLRIVAASVEGVEREELIAMVDALKQRLGSGVVVLGSVIGQKPAFVVGVTPDLVREKGIRAGDLAKHVASITGGGGGGRPELAQAGGRDPSKLREALDAVVPFVRQKLNA